MKWVNGSMSSGPMTLIYYVRTETTEQRNGNQLAKVELTTREDPEGPFAFYSRLVFIGFFI
jgi:hypothetical protein